MPSRALSILIAVVSLLFVGSGVVFADGDKDHKDHGKAAVTIGNDDHSKSDKDDHGDKGDHAKVDVKTNDDHGKAGIRVDVQGQDGDHRVTICHPTGSDTNPFVVIIIDKHALEAHEGHGDLIPAPANGCPPAITTEAKVKVELKAKEAEEHEARVELKNERGEVLLTPGTLTLTLPCGDVATFQLTGTFKLEGDDEDEAHLQLHMLKLGMLDLSQAVCTIGTGNLSLMVLASNGGTLTVTPVILEALQTNVSFEVIPVLLSPIPSENGAGFESLLMVAPSVFPFPSLPISSENGFGFGGPLVSGLR